MSGSYFPTTFDGGRSIASFQGLSSDRLFSDYSEFTFNRYSKFGKMEFSALPHLGFSYSFGGQGAQFLRAKYNHAFLDNTVLQLNYARDVGTGVIRNGAFTNNNVRLQFQHRGNHYSVRLKGAYLSKALGHSYGVVEDTIDRLYDLEYYPVRKNDAQSTNKVGQVNVSNFFNVLPDSIHQLGLMINHEYRIMNRVYTESSDTLTALYDTLYIDTFATRDQYNIASISNGGGLYYFSKKFYAHATADYNYWKYQNLGVDQDSTEIDLNAYFRISLRDFSVLNDFNFNLVGRFNEFSEHARAEYKSNQIKVFADFLMESQAPNVMQRRYFANEVSYKNNNIELQSWLRGKAGVKFTTKNEKVTTGLNGDFTSVTRLYYFDGEKWSTDSLNTNFATITAYSALSFGVFNFHPRIVYAFDQNNYLPDFQVYGRIYVKGKLFKAKKLEAMVGVDASYITGFNNKAYLPYMDTYNWLASSGSFAPMANLHAFVNFGIADFRFYFRYENIGYYWSDINNRVVANYPISRPRMRIGITWDFFN